MGLRGPGGGKICHLLCFFEDLGELFQLACVEVDQKLYGQIGRSWIGSLRT